MFQALLKVEKRKEVGKRYTRQIRHAGRVPAIYYIHGEEPIAISVDEKELHGVIHSEQNIIDLAFDGKKKVKSVIRDIQWDPVAGRPVHVDFMGIKMTENVTVDIPVHLIGTPIGVKRDGGILQQQLREISIECLPSDIPEHFEVDVEALEVGDSLRVADLQIEKVHILTDPEQSIASVQHPKVVKEPEVVEVEGEEGEEAAEAPAEGDETGEGTAE